MKLSIRGKGEVWIYERNVGSILDQAMKGAIKGEVKLQGEDDLDKIRAKLHPRKKKG